MLEIRLGAVILNLQERMLSSANSVNLKIELGFGKSLIKIKNSKDPKMDSWGTSSVTGWSVEFVKTYCVRSDKWYSNQR